MDTGFFTHDELLCFGFKSIGDNVLISKKASIYGAEQMSIGNNVRIDDFVLLVGNIEIHNYVHIGAFSGLHASQGGRIVFYDFSGISSNVNIYASSDSFDGEYCTARPGLPDDCMKTHCSDVYLGKYSQVGTGSTIIPGGNLGEGTAVGAMSLVNKALKPWGIYYGIPCRFEKEREKSLISKIEAVLKKESV